MNNLKRAVMLSVLALMMLLGAGAQTAFAEETSCTRTLGAVTVDNVRVPAGKTCTLNKTIVKGTVKVERNATLYAKTARINGNVQAEGAKLVSVTANTTVGGSIQIVQGGAATINRARVNGDILFDDNTRAFRATNNKVGGNVQVFQNTGGVTISNNTIDGNLQCKENTPRPTGTGNIVKGSKEDQCARL